MANESHVFISITELKPSFTGSANPGWRRSLTPSRTASAAPSANARSGIFPLRSLPTASAWVTPR